MSNLPKVCDVVASDHFVCVMEINAVRKVEAQRKIGGNIMPYLQH